MKEVRLSSRISNEEKESEMIRKILVLALVAIFSISLAGCVSDSGYYDPGRSAGAGALGGAVGGAAIGSIIGAATGSPATGAWVGAATGAIVGGVGGYLYAQHRNSVIRERQAAGECSRTGKLIKFHEYKSYINRYL